MITQQSQPFDDFEPLATETIMLSDTSTQWAQRVCRDIADTDKQWLSFLRALAIAGFEQWLNQGVTQLSITHGQNAVLATDASIQVGGFRLCILPLGALGDDQVIIPAMAVNGEDKAHLYVLIEVHEEVDQVRVATSLRHDQLQAYLEQHIEQPMPPGTDQYVVPVTQFTVPPEKLLLYLSCLQPEALIPSRIVAEDEVTIPSSIQSAVTRVINTGKWLQGQLDAVADELAWQLIPSLTPSYGLRGFGETDNPIEKVPEILDELRGRGVDVPADAAGACQTMAIGDFDCHIYTLVWQLPETHEWSLFVLVGPATNEPLSVGMRLQVSDQTSVMSTSEVRQDAATTYLYSQVIGNLDEQFVVEIGMSNSEKVTLPPFSFT